MTLIIFALDNHCWSIVLRHQWETKDYLVTCLKCRVLGHPVSFYFFFKIKESAFLTRATLQHVGCTLKKHGSMLLRAHRIVKNEKCHFRLSTNSHKLCLQSIPLWLIIKPVGTVFTRNQLAERLQEESVNGSNMGNNFVHPKYRSVSF